MRLSHPQDQIRSLWSNVMVRSSILVSAMPVRGEMLHLLHYYQSLKSIMTQKEGNDSKTEQVMLNEKMALYRYLTNVALRGSVIIHFGECGVCRADPTSYCYKAHTSSSLDQNEDILRSRGYIVLISLISLLC